MQQEKRQELAQRLEDCCLCPQPPQGGGGKKTQATASPLSWLVWIQAAEELAIKDGPLLEQVVADILTEVKKVSGS